MIFKVLNQPKALYEDSFALLTLKVKSKFNKVLCHAKVDKPFSLSFY